MINILIPCSGSGQRFKDAGYKLPKPLIDVNGRPMLDRVIENLSPSNRGFKIIIMPQFDLNMTVNSEIDVVPVFGLTKGAASTVLQAREYIDTDDPLIIASCDQLIDWDINKFIDFSKGLDGSVVTYKATEPYHSFCRVYKDKVVEVAEKEVISDNANIGVYYFGEGRDFVTAAEMMIDQDDNFNGEFYISKVYNHLINLGKKNIKIYELPRENCHILGTPVTLRKYLNDHSETTR